MRPTNVRWGVIALLFFATTINHLDRTNLSLARYIFHFPCELLVGRGSIIPKHRCHNA
jgi:hypothetical protein